MNNKLFVYLFIDVFIYLFMGLFVYSVDKPKFYNFEKKYKQQS